MCPEEKVPAFVDACKVALLSLFGDDPSKSEFYGRIINKPQFNRIIQMLEKQKTVNGCKIVTGGDYSIEDLYIAPTIITGVGKDAIKNAIMAQEIFGPLLPIISVKSTTEAIQFINEG